MTIHTKHCDCARCIVGDPMGQTTMHSVDEMPRRVPRDLPSAPEMPAVPALACSFCKRTGVGLVGGDLDSNAYVCADCTAFHADIFAPDDEPDGETPPPRETGPGTTDVASDDQGDEREATAPRTGNVAQSRPVSVSTQGELPTVIYVTANGMWLRREYPHLDATPYTRGTDLHRYMALEEEIEGLTSDLAASRAHVATMHRRAQRLEGIEAKCAALRDSNARETKGIRDGFRWRLRMLTGRMREVMDLLRFFGASTTYVDLRDGKTRRHAYPCFMIADLAQQRDTARADLAETESRVKETILALGKQQTDLHRALKKVVEAYDAHDFHPSDRMVIDCTDLGRAIAAARSMVAP